jgi:hypothetical protein
VLDGSTYVLEVHLGFDIVLQDKVLRLKGILSPPARGKSKCEEGLAARDFAIDRLLNTEVVIDVEDSKKGLINLYAKDHVNEEGEVVYVDFGSLLLDKGMAVITEE